MKLYIRRVGKSARRKRRRKLFSENSSLVPVLAAGKWRATKTVDMAIRDLGGCRT